MLKRSEVSAAPYASAPVDSSDEVSIFEIGATILRQRWRILRYMLAGGVLAILPVLFQKLTYTATTSFVPQVLDSQPSDLRSLAGQFGVSLGGGGSSAQSPQFYADLLRSPVILRAIAADSFPVVEDRAPRKPFLDLMNVSGDSYNQRLEQGTQVLRQLMSAGVARETGVLTLAVTTQWPSVSAAIANEAVDGVNAFNLSTRKSQAVEERRFTEARLAEARVVLRDAEDRLQSFLQRNRQLQNSAELSFERDRLQREVSLQQEIVGSLAKSYEEVRIREVRDVPVITVIERASAPTRPNPRGRVKRALLGMLLGGLFGVILALSARMLQQKRIAGDPDSDAFFAVVSEFREDLRRLLPWKRRRQPVR
jgi:uncharacterized protein involved in exopolysaccharide biosynthesis